MNAEVGREGSHFRGGGREFSGPSAEECALGKVVGLDLRPIVVVAFEFDDAPPLRMEDDVSGFVEEAEPDAVLVLARPVRAITGRSGPSQRTAADARVPVSDGVYTTATPTSAQRCGSSGKDCARGSRVSSGSSARATAASRRGRRAARRPGGTQPRDRRTREDRRRRRLSGNPRRVDAQLALKDQLPGIDGHPVSDAGNSTTACRSAPLTAFTAFRWLPSEVRVRSARLPSWSARMRMEVVGPPTPGRWRGLSCESQEPAASDRGPGRACSPGGRVDP